MPSRLNALASVPPPRQYGTTVAAGSSSRRASAMAVNHGVSIGASTGGLVLQELAGDAGFEQGVDGGQQLVDGAGQGADVDLGGGGAGDDVDLVAGLQHGRGGGAAHGVLD